MTTLFNPSDLPFPMPDFKPGWVWLVGAGPGDPGLMTLYALAGLRAADVIVYDALVSPDILKVARPDAELIHAGKRGGKPSPKQPDISARLVALAQGGKKVLRLKGGDPFVFGRGGEEALALVEAGIPFRLIPGVTAGVAAPAYAGIPVTHRDTNHAVTFVTGHAQTGDVPDSVNWPALAAGSQVLVLYMAIKHLGRIAADLIRAGRAEDEPVAIISQATTSLQSVLRGTLGDIADKAAADGVTPPAIVVIGKVVDLADQLNWLATTGGSDLTSGPVG